MKLFYMRQAIMAVAFAGLSLPFSAHAQTINLPGNESPTFGFGKGGLATFGQTFTAPTGSNFLQGFSFWLSNDSSLGASNPSSLLFQAYVMRWDAANGRATGPVLYSSNVRTGPTSLSQQYSFATGDLGVSASQQYVAFLSASSQLGLIPTAQALAIMETSLAGTYTGGQFVFADNGNSLALLSTSEWLFTGSPEYQSHFTATFASNAVSVVPEPSSLMLLLAGVAATAAMARKRRQL